MSSRTRHLAKALTWRAICTATTLATGWLVTGEAKAGAAIAGADAVIKIVLYYLHERAWHKTKASERQSDGEREPD